MKYIISIIIFLLLIFSGVLGYDYYRRHMQLELKNIQISESEVRIRDLEGNIQELKQKNKELSDKVAVQKKRIEHLEKFIADKNLNVPQQTSAENSNDAADDSVADSSSLWYWIVFAVIIVTIAIIIVICKIQKRSSSEFRKNKKFTCPSCGWEYRTPVAECENCKTKF